MQATDPTTAAAPPRRANTFYHYSMATPVVDLLLTYYVLVCAGAEACL